MHRLVLAIRDYKLDAIILLSILVPIFSEIFAILERCHGAFKGIYFLLLLTCRCLLSRGSSIFNPFICD